MPYQAVDQAVQQLEASSLCTDPDCCGMDRGHEAAKWGVEAGIRFAMSAIAYRIRAELVCCPPDEIDAAQAAMKAGADPVHFHAICYWSEMSARLAEDMHSLLDSPYECRGHHEGECWGGARCRRLKHTICAECNACTICEEHVICTKM